METLMGRVSSVIRANKLGPAEEEGARIRAKTSCGRVDDDAVGRDDKRVTAVLASPVNKTRVGNAAIQGDADGYISDGAESYDPENVSTNFEKEIMSVTRKYTNQLGKVDEIIGQNKDLQTKLEAEMKKNAALTAKNEELQEKIAVATRTVNSYKSDSGKAKLKFVAEMLEALQ